MTKIYEENAQPKAHLVPTLLQSARECEVSLVDLLIDSFSGARAL